MTLMMMTMMEMLTIMVVIPRMMEILPPIWRTYFFLRDGVQQICHQPTPPHPEFRKILHFLSFWIVEHFPYHLFITISSYGLVVAGLERVGIGKGFVIVILGAPTTHPPPSSNNILVGKIQKYVKKVSKRVFFDIWGAPTTIIETPSTTIFRQKSPG